MSADGDIGPARCQARRIVVALLQRRPSHRHSTAVIALVAIVMSLLPMLSAWSAAAAQDGGPDVLRIHRRFYPVLLDPQRGGFLPDVSVTELVYEGLTRIDANAAVAPAAAESWEFSEDGRTLTFHLREGLTYSDGSALTAERFRDAALRTCHPLTAGLYQGILFPIEGCEALANSSSPDAEGALAEEFGVEAPDDRTVVIRLREPAPYFPAVASLGVFFPAKVELIEAGGDDWWLDPANHVGNGPFVLESMEEEQLDSFRANKRYWGGRPALDGIDYVYIADNAVALEAYQHDQIDIMFVDPDQIPAITGDETLSQEFLRFRQASTLAFSFNLRKPPFDDKKVREAFAYAFDRETWCAEIQNGGCLPTTTWIPEGIPGHVDDATYAFDPEKARQALAESSYGSASALPPITYVYLSDDPAERIRSEWMAGQFRDVLGVELELVGYEYATWVDLFFSAEHFPQMMHTGWGQTYPDPQNWLSINYTCAADNLAVNVGYCNEEFDRLIAQADTELDPDKRTALYEQAHRLLLADVPSVITDNAANLFLIKPSVTGYTPTTSDFAFPGEHGSLLNLDVER
jgi:oligopeptide transport system substrate-binding protein